MALLIIPGKGRNHLTFETSDKELEVRTATLIRIQPEIDPSQHAKSVSQRKEENEIVFL